MNTTETTRARHAEESRSTDEPARPRRRRSRSRIAAVLAALTLVVVMVGAESAPASAATYYGTSGRPGGISARVEVRKLHLPTGQVVTGIQVHANFGRSPALSGYQNVHYSVYLQVWNGSTWVTISQPAGVLPIQSYESFNGTQPIDFKYGMGNAYYRVSVAAVWTNAQGVRIGSTGYLINGSDYRCSIGCYTGPDWVWFI